MNNQRSMKRLLTCHPRCISAIVVVLAVPGVACGSEVEIPEVPDPLEILVEADILRTDEQKGPKPVSKYAIGLSVTSSPQYAGSSRREFNVRPVVGYRYGRFKISTSGGSGVMGFGELAQTSGASAELISTKSLRLKATLRLNNGRQMSDSPDLIGIPEIRRTLTGRLSASYKLSPHWSLGLTFGWDLLGRGAGSVARTGIGYRTRLNARTEMTIGAAVSYASATHMRAYFGVPLAAQTADRPAFAPDDGIKDANLGISTMTALTNNWIAFGRIGYVRMLGDARDSPLTTGGSSVSVTLGIAYRCCYK